MIERALLEYRAPVLDALARIVPSSSPLRDILYEPIRRHALRPGKGLRPALCLATCRALGGGLEAALPTAAVLELYHNAFLVHDDVEDGSLLRRDAPTLHALYGMPIAVNAGDAMLALALEPLLDNTRLVGLGKALRILEVVARMARETAEGQAMELDWIRRGVAAPGDEAYLSMVEKKTAAYSFVAPVLIGAIVAGAPAERSRRLEHFARQLGIAFQIRDDVLSLGPAGEGWGKAPLDDLWEGKRTLVLAHALRAATSTERARAERVLRKGRPTPRDRAMDGVLDGLQGAGDLTPAGRRALDAALAPAGGLEGLKGEDDVRFLLELIERSGSLDEADRTAARFAEDARETLDGCDEWLVASEHRDFLYGLVQFVCRRRH